MFTISRDTPAYYITSVTRNRLAVFQKDQMKEVVCNSLDEARTSSGLLLFAYVVMNDHFHLLVATERKPSEALRYVNGISSRRVINYLKDHNYESSLRKLRHADLKNRYRYSVWDHHPNLKLILTKVCLCKKLTTYITIRFVLGSWSVRSITNGQALGPGKSALKKMSLCGSILTLSLGIFARHSLAIYEGPLPERHSLSAQDAAKPHVATCCCRFAAP